MFDAADITSDFRSLKFNVSVDSTGVETNPSDNVANISLALLSQADMEIRGSSYLEQVFYDNEEDRPSDLKDKPNYASVQHKYTILKYLPTPVKAVAISFLIPVNFTQGGSEVNFLQMYEPSAHIGNQPMTCTLQNTDFLRLEQTGDDATNTERHNDEELIDDRQISRRRKRQAKSPPAIESPPSNGTFLINCTSVGSRVRCVRLTCQSVPFLTPAARAVVTLDLRVDVHAMRPLLAGRDVFDIVSHGFVQILDGAAISADVNRRPDRAAVTTALLPARLQPQPVAVWIIVLSVVAALALLAIIAYVLYRAGFFRRAKHEQLLDEQQDAEVEQNFSGPVATDRLNPEED